MARAHIVFTFAAVFLQQRRQLPELSGRQAHGPALGPSRRRRDLASACPSAAAVPPPRRTTRSCSTSRSSSRFIRRFSRATRYVCHRQHLSPGEGTAQLLCFRRQVRSSDTASYFSSTQRERTVSSSAEALSVQKTKAA